MDEDLRQYLVGMEQRIDGRLTATEQQLDGRLTAMEQRLDDRITATEQRLVSVLASEIGTLHEQIKQVEQRLGARIEAVEARQRHDAGLITSLMELVLKQTRWHEQTDNAIVDLAARNAEVGRRLDDLGRSKAS